MIWCRSVSMSSYTMYTSLNLSLLVGIIMSMMAMMFSWRRCLSSLISSKVRLASVRFSNAFPGQVNVCVSVSFESFGLRDASVNLVLRPSPSSVPLRSGRTDFLDGHFLLVFKLRGAHHPVRALADGLDGRVGLVNLEVCPPQLCTHNHEFVCARDCMSGR